MNIDLAMRQVSGRCGHGGMPPFFRMMALVCGMLAIGAVRAEPVIQVSGSFTVTPTGAAAYTIPIDVPPGTAGMKPAISLNYTSQAGSGIVGVGWTLGGLPSIVRCPAIVATEGSAGSVTYTPSDRFCLEGQKLIDVGGGDYGADGAVYYTEVNGFSRIVSHVIAGQNGPASFTVQTKSGQTMTFGDPAGPGGPTGASPLATGKGVARVWALSEIADTKGNYLTITYSTSPNGLTGGAGEAPYPVMIVYTGNTTNNKSGPNSVQFAYAARPATDVIDNWIAGVESRTSFELTDIKTCTIPILGSCTHAAGYLVSDFKLGYQTSPTSGRTRLLSVTRCDTDSDCQSPTYSGGTFTQPACVANGDCLLPTTFSWQDAAIPGCSSATACPVMVSTNGSSQNANGSKASFHPIFGNFDGSGRTSIAWIPLDQYGRTQAGTMYFWLAKPDGTFVQDSSSIAITAGYRVYSGDFNADGLTDLLFDAEYQNQDPNQGPYGSYGIANIWKNLGRSAWASTGGAKFVVSANLTVPETPNQSPIIGDFDGDGKSDILWTQLDQNGHTYFGSGGQPNGGAWIWSGLTNGSGTTWTYTQTYFSSAIPNGVQPYLVDLDGDGKTDLVFDVEDSDDRNDGSISELISRGLVSGHIAFQASRYPLITGGSNSPITGYQPHFGDFIGNGTSSIYWVPVDVNGHGIGSGTGNSILWLADGDGNFRASTGPSAAYHVPLIGDFNGDGRADIALALETYNSTR